MSEQIASPQPPPRSPSPPRLSPGPSPFPDASPSPHASLPPHASPPPHASLPPHASPPPHESPPPHASPPPDVSLLLRAHAERRWLSREVVPVVRQIETSEGLPEEQVPAALAYLEVIWAEAIVRGHATDTARRLLDADGSGEQPLLARAHRDHRAVEHLRAVVAQRVARLLAAPQPRAAV